MKPIRGKTIHFTAPDKEGRQTVYDPSLVGFFTPSHNEIIPVGDYISKKQAREVLKKYEQMPFSPTTFSRIRQSLGLPNNEV